MFLNSSSLCEACSLENCQKCKSLEECEICDDGFLLTLGECVKEDNSTSPTCEFKFCKECSNDNSSCATCEDGFDIKDGECTQTYGWYKLFQVFENRDRLYTTDVTDDDLRLVVAEENGISIFRRNSREDDFVETSPKAIGKTVQADITPTGDFLLGLPHL